MEIEVGGNNFRGSYDFVPSRHMRQKRHGKTTTLASKSKIQVSLPKISLAFSRTKKIVSKALYWGRGGTFRVIMLAAFVILVGAFFLPYASDKETVLGASGVSEQEVHFEFGGDIIASDVIYNYGNGLIKIPDDRPNYYITQYTVQSGDTLSSIAKKFEINTDTITWANDLHGQTLRVGQVLQIPPIDGVLYTVKKGDTLDKIVKKYKLTDKGYSDQSIVDWNLELEAPYTLTEGMVLIIPGAEVEKPVVASTVSSGSGKTSSRGGVWAPASPGTFIKPVYGGIGKLSTHFRLGSHDGIDIYDHSAPDIVASAGGLVVKAGWEKGGCGNGVWIDHENGFMTHYCHMYSYYVAAGDRVVQGQRIGKMGSTGRSTGTHCHFAIMYKGTYVDPLNYFSI